jgi:hypothetical protein
MISGTSQRVVVKKPVPNDSIVVIVAQVSAILMFRQLMTLLATN